MIKNFKLKKWTDVEGMKIKIQRKNLLNNIVKINVLKSKKVLKEIRKIKFKFTNKLFKIIITCKECKLVEEVINKHQDIWIIDYNNKRYIENNHNNNKVKTFLLNSSIINTTFPKEIFLQQTEIFKGLTNSTSLMDFNNNHFDFY